MLSSLHCAAFDVLTTLLAQRDRLVSLSLPVDFAGIDWSSVTVVALLAILVIPAVFVGIELFYFADRCPKGGKHEFVPDERGAGWVVCPKCGAEDF